MRCARVRGPNKCQKRPTIGAKETYYVRSFEMQRARARAHTHTHITYIHIHSVIRGPTTDMALLSAAAEDNSLKKKKVIYIVTFCSKCTALPFQKAQLDHSNSLAVLFFFYFLNVLGR
jgi:hypothetical protein